MPRNERGGGRLSSTSGAIGELASGTAKYAIGGLVARAVTLLSIPIYLRFLSAHDFGIQTIALVNEQVLVILSGTAITNAVAKYYSDAHRAGSGEGAVVGTATTGLAALGIALALLWELVAGPIAAATLDESDASVLVVRLIGISFVASLFTNLALALCQLRTEILRYSVLNITKYVSAFAFGLFFLWPLGMGVVGIVLGWALSSVIVAAAAIVWLARTFRLGFNAMILRRLVTYGGPFVPAALLMLLLNGSDRYILRRLADLSAVGVYATAYTAASAFNLLLVTPFKQAWAPLMWKMRERPDEAALHRRVLRYYVAAMVLALMATTVASPLLMTILAGQRPDFISASFAIPLICLGFVLFGTYDVLAAGYFFAARTMYYTITVAASAALDVALNLMLDPVIGLWGTAVAFAVSYLLFAVLSGIFGGRLFPQGHDWSRLATATGLGLAATTVFLYLRAVDYGLGLVVGIVLVCALPLLFVAAHVVEAEELRALRAALWRLRTRVWPPRTTRHDG